MIKERINEKLLDFTQLKDELILAMVTLEKLPVEIEAAIKKYEGSFEKIKDYLEDKPFSKLEKADKLLYKNIYSKLPSQIIYHPLNIFKEEIDTAMWTFRNQLMAIKGALKAFDGDFKKMQDYLIKKIIPKLIEGNDLLKATLKRIIAIIEENRSHFRKAA
ncbi:hypothetical protein HOI26_03275 [Candidatus Woesearchaeota archaeon]|nr:hypothetical protein [Candidatus Woesearchaeota archaeon]